MTEEFADISSHQARADITAYATARHGRLLLKATEGVGYRNPYFPGWWALAGELGLARGAYHYAKPSRPSVTGQGEAAHFAATLASIGGLGPRDWVCLDVEDPDEHGSRAGWHAAEFCHHMAEIGFPSGVVYSYTPYLTRVGLTPGMLPAGWRNLHVANYSDVPDDRVPLPPGWGRGQVVARQYSESARQPGIPGGSDANRVVREWLPEIGDTMTPDQMDTLAAAIAAVPGAVSRQLTAEFRRASHAGKTTSGVRVGTAGEAAGVVFLSLADVKERLAAIERELGIPPRPERTLSDGERVLGVVLAVDSGAGEEDDSDQSPPT